MSKRTVKFNLVKKYKIKFSTPFFLCGSQILIVTQEDKNRLQAANIENMKFL
jgi:hypothetical protein